MSVDSLHIPDLILNLYVIIWAIGFTVGKMVPALCKSQGKDNKLEYNFLMICIYLNLEIKSENNFIVNRKHTSCYNIKILCWLAS